MLLQVVIGTMHLHNNGFLHCDLKAPNILVQTAADGRVVLKVADLGLARPYSIGGTPFVTP
jgi:serine/threonine protein kinase